MSDYAAVVSRSTFAYRLAAFGHKPYWVTNSGDGRYCFISFSGDDRVSVVSYAKEKEVASVPVGDHPQRMRMGTIRCDYLAPAVDCVAPRISRARVQRGRRLRLRVSEPSLLRVSILRARPGRWKRIRIIRRRVRAGVNRLRIGRLPAAGRYHLRIRATDAAGNSSRTKRVFFRIR